jgi:hypothetical protein
MNDQFHLRESLCLFHGCKFILDVDMFDRISLSGALLIAGFTWAQSQTSQPEAATQSRIQNTCQYKALRKRAKTASDFKALSAWCTDQSAVCRRKIAQLEAELNDYHSGSPRPAPKYPPRDQTLRDLIAHYRIVAGNWQRSAENYMARSVKLEVTGTNR